MECTHRPPINLFENYHDQHEYSLVYLSWYLLSNPTNPSRPHWSEHKRSRWYSPPSQDTTTETAPGLLDIVGLELRSWDAVADTNIISLRNGHRYRRKISLSPYGAVILTILTWLHIHCHPPNFPSTKLAQITWRFAATQTDLTCPALGLIIQAPCYTNY